VIVAGAFNNTTFPHDLTPRLYGVPGKKSGDVNTVVQVVVLLLLPNLVLMSLVPPVSFHITDFFSLKNDIPIISFFATITIWSSILVSIYCVNNGKC
jgi:hypothetical protein